MTARDPKLDLGELTGAERDKLVRILAKLVQERELEAKGRISRRRERVHGG